MESKDSVTSQDSVAVFARRSRLKTSFYFVCTYILVKYRQVIDPSLDDQVVCFDLCCTRTQRTDLRFRTGSVVSSRVMVVSKSCGVYLRFQ